MAKKVTEVSKKDAPVRELTEAFIRPEDLGA